jgi:glucosamine kinase
VLLAIRRGFEAAGPGGAAAATLRAGRRISGVSHGRWRDAFLAGDPGFAALEAETDSFTVLMGAHGGQPGWC